MKIAKVFDIPIVHSTINVKTASSSSARYGLRSAWRFRRSTLCARAMRSIRPSTRSAAPLSKAHRAGLERVVQAGGQPTSWVALACELQRDLETVQEVIEIVLTERLLKEE